jgi:hypothetical protein
VLPMVNPFAPCGFPMRFGGGLTQREPFFLVRAIAERESRVRVRASVRVSGSYIITWALAAPLSDFARRTGGACLCPANGVEEPDLDGSTAPELGDQRSPHQRIVRESAAEVPRGAPRAPTLGTKCPRAPDMHGYVAEARPQSWLPLTFLIC